jgi:hypothetical protein
MEEYHQHVHVHMLLNVHIPPIYILTDPRHLLNTAPLVDANEEHPLFLGKPWKDWGSSIWCSLPNHWNCALTARASVDKAGPGS